jgi:hypothetical protein
VAALILITMGNEQSSPSHSNGPGRPQSLAECTNHKTGRVDSTRDTLYLRERKAEEDAQFESEIAGCAKRCWQTAQDLEDEAGAAPKKRTRSIKKGSLQIINDEGERIAATPRETQWYYLYVLNPQLQEKKFNQRF